MLIARLARSLVGSFEQRSRSFGTTPQALSLTEFLEQPLKEGETRVAGKDFLPAARCSALGGTTF